MAQQAQTRKQTLWAGALLLTLGHMDATAGPTCCLHRQPLHMAAELTKPHSTHCGRLFGEMNRGLLRRRREDCRQEPLLCQLEIKCNHHTLCAEPQRQNRAAYQPTANKGNQAEPRRAPRETACSPKAQPVQPRLMAKGRLDRTRSVQSQLSVPTSANAAQGQLVSPQVCKGAERDPCPSEVARAETAGTPVII